MSKRNDHANLQEGVRELLYQTLETALCGAAIYAAALECAGRTALRDEWTKRHAQTQVHQQVLLSVFEALGLDPMAQTRGRTAVSACCRALFEVVAYARRSKEPAMAQLIAAECVMLAEAKDRQNWALIGFAADALSGAVAKVLKDAYASIWADEARHLYHAKGWARELWIESMGFEPMLPPPEERETAEFASAAARAQWPRSGTVH
ncbi:hypothetical protein WS67_08300 [Burkholderia singularis]|uniref:Ferritin-like domain-containing protein n=1 Tax=Burkholderia singularis TaxID=1503053 RepID=A0A103E5G1_9BURK|nr:MULTISPECIES: hypothetical protein [Burkholderia]AOK31454.1 hypothetical protein AQ611_17920 [Burkholderia sp. Bp7605]KVE28708.1 hypothetical protein WS67_08300 [Burkholderia singularis]